MSDMQTLITVVHIVTCAFLVLVVLMQSGKGAEISATLGGSSQTVFGSTGGANFFQKLTYGLAAVFFTTSMLLTLASGKNQKSVFDTAPAGSVETAPVEGAPAATTTTPGTATGGTAAPAASTGSAPAAATAGAPAASTGNAPAAAAPKNDAAPAKSQ